MQTRIIYIGIILSVFLLTNGCSSKGIHGYKPKSQDEEAIVSVFKKLEKAWNNQDIEGLIAYYHDDAKSMFSNRRMHTKAQFKNALPSVIARLPESRYLEPSSINISGNEAEVKI